MDFVDPRRNQEPVKWVSLGGNFKDEMNSLTKDAETNGDVEDWDAGGAALQVISRGDAWIEFEATEFDKSHVLGVSSGAGPDTDISIADITFALSLNRDGKVYVLENGAAIITPVIVGGEHLTYTEADRFRIRIEDNHDDTATLKFMKITDPKSCEVGKKCLDVQIAGRPCRIRPIRCASTRRSARRARR